LGNQLYIEAWRILQGLKDTNESEKLSKKGMVYKPEEERSYHIQDCREN
jgi:hypothetical protein